VMQAFVVRLIRLFLCSRLVGVLTLSAVACVTPSRGRMDRQTASPPAHAMAPTGSASSASAPRKRVAGTQFVVEVARNEIRLDHETVEETRNLEPKLQRLDGLFTAVRARHAADGPGLYTFRVAPNVPAWLWKSAFQTTAFAGFPQARVDDLSLPFVIRARVPQPPHMPAPPEPALGVAMAVHARAVELAGFRDGLRVLLSNADSEREVVDGLASLCQKKPGCIEGGLLWVDNGVEFSRVARMLGALRSAVASSAAITIVVTPPDPPRLSNYFNPAVPRVRFHGFSTAVSGRLAPELIQQQVRADYGKMRSCYERALTRNPKLTGRVVTRFVIGRDGRVSAARAVYPNSATGEEERNASPVPGLELADDVISAEVLGETAPQNVSTLPDRDVANCILDVFRQLRFPKPAGGIVTVVYPIQFSPD
jgi:hypothetical protein